MREALLGHVSCTVVHIEWLLTADADARVCCSPSDVAREDNLSSRWIRRWVLSTVKGIPEPFPLLPYTERCERSPFCDRIKRGWWRLRCCSLEHCFRCRLPVHVHRQLNLVFQDHLYSLYGRVSCFILRCPWMSGQLNELLNPIKNLLAHAAPVGSSRPPYRRSRRFPEKPSRIGGRTPWR